MDKIVIKNKTVLPASPKTKLVIAEQEKAMLRHEFELCRQRLMKVTRRVQDLRADIFFKHQPPKK